MAANEFLRFCQNDTTTNLLTQSEYNADSQRLIGNQPGPARSKLVNKVLRQTSLFSAGVAQWIADLQADDLLDSLTPAQIQARFDAAFSARFAALLLAAQVQLPGTMIMWPASTPPAGWLKRNGTAYSRTTYAALFAVIGTTYGAGDGSTTFNLPDDRAIFERGWDDSRGVDVGRVFGSDQASQNLTHTHTGSANSASLTGSMSLNQTGFTAASGIAALGGSSTRFDGGTGYTGSQSVNLNATHGHTLTINSSGGSESRPFNRAYLPIIKF